MSQGTHERRNYRPPHGVDAGDPVVGRRYAAWAKPSTKNHPCMMNKLYNKSTRTVNYHTKPRASEEMGPLNAPCVTMSGPNHIAFRTLFHSDRSCQLFVESSNRTQRWGRDDHDIVVPRG